MTVDPRDELWRAAFDTYYDSYYEELLADRLINVWRRVDEVTRILAALTASTSAVTGWALWAQQYSRNVWAVLAGFAAVLTILHAHRSGLSLVERAHKPPEPQGIEVLR